MEATDFISIVLEKRTIINQEIISPSFFNNKEGFNYMHLYALKTKCQIAYILLYEKMKVFLKKRKISQIIYENNDIIYATGGYTKNENCR